jgi:hypothetical protein
MKWFQFRKNRLPLFILIPITTIFITVFVLQIIFNPTSMTFSTFSELSRYRNLGPRFENLQCNGPIRLSRDNPFSNDFKVSGKFNDTNYYLIWRFGIENLNDAIEFVELAQPGLIIKKTDKLYWTDSFDYESYSYKFSLMKNGEFYADIRSLRK